MSQSDTQKKVLESRIALESKSGVGLYAATGVCK